MFLSKIAMWMVGNKVTRPLYQLLSKMGLIQFKRYLFRLYFHKNPTQKMKDEKQFFSEHAQELKKVYDFLEDDRSRTVFENILRFRATSDWTCLKKSAGKDNERNQYLVPELQFSDHEIIVDCGAYNGDSTKRFYKDIPGCRVIALEPDETNFASLSQLKLDGLVPVKAGAWSEDKSLTFSDNGGGTVGGAIDPLGNTTIEVKALDHIPECQSATYIKMDIEGAELEALKGAENIIKNRKPKLAICLYHRPQDFFEIPLYIKKLNPEYRLFVHQHSQDTVLYAV